MSKGLLWGLILLGLCVVLIIFNRGRVDINFLVGTVSVLKSIAFLVCLGLGIVIGLLLK